MAAFTQPDGATVQKRRSDRIFIRIPLSIVGTDPDGHSFGGRAVTEIVSRYGASIVTKLSLFPEQQVTLIPTDKKRVLARVIGQTSIGSNGHTYGSAFLNATIEYWGIHFPPVAEALATSTHVECCDCHAREMVRLDELESEVLRANDRLRRLCPRCGTVTSWQLVDDDGVNRRIAQPSRESPPQQKREQSTTAPPTEVADADRPQPRMYQRVRVKMKACISKPGLDDDIVNTINVSRGGVAVRSERVYATESWIQLAVPYTPAAANIFVPARIVWRGDLEGAHQYGIKYVTG